MDIALCKTIDRIRAENASLTGDDLKAFKELHDGIKRLADRVFRQASISSLSSQDIIASVYITGLYHGSELERQKREA